MAYFDKVPEILYLKYDKNPQNGTYIAIKNSFARIKLIDDVVPAATVFDDYFIKDGERPDTISMDYYSDPGNDWIIMMINNIRNLYDDWPMEHSSFNEYLNSKYDDVTAVHHYETIEQIHNDNMILPAGLHVGEAYQFVTPEGNLVSKEASRGPISNYIYELRKNDKKREILILKPSLLDEFIEIFEKEMKFTPSTEYVSSSLKISKN
jgi:hypothetical protein